MGGEGVTWIGQAPFTDEKHIFANLGDGTYYHSGILAIRAAIAANVNITYKILYNDAVAMTGGQDGPLSPADIAKQVAAEGVKRIIVVSDEPDEYPSGYYSPDIRIHHRDELDAVQRELREIPASPCCSTTRRARRRSAGAGSAHLPRSRAARRHQRARVRRLRRLRRAVELRVGGAGRDRVRPQAHHRPVLVQQGLLLREGFCPSIFATVEGGARAGRRRQRRSTSRACRTRWCRAPRNRTASS